ncbi:hypothetical protein NAI54_10305, partial [Francisella tularensis subsp. holarctica]|uniref:hypothetical protein n=1 Tax=Francisella tularensis TaxID=263 RepID=UPI002381B8CD
HLIIDNLEKLKLTKKYSKLALHKDSSTRKQNIDNKYIHALYRCCDEVVIPEQIYCCGFAGDKGVPTPEVNARRLASIKPHS